MPAGDLLRDLGDLRRRVIELERTAQATTTAAAVTLRRSYRTSREQEQREAWRRLEPPTSLVRWQARAGEADRPDLVASLIDRLRRGDPVADSLGNTDPFIGISNILRNPVMAGFEPATASTGAFVSCSDGWEIGHTVNSGTASLNSISRYYGRGTLNSNPLNSDIIEWATTVAASSNVDFYLRAGSFTPNNFAPPPYLIGAFRLVNFDVSVDPDVQSLYVRVEIRDTFDSSVIAQSRNFTAAELVDLGLNATFRLYGSTVAGGAPKVSGHQYQIYLHVHIESKASGTVAFFTYLGEPQFVYGYSPDPPAYAPQIAQWFPDRVRQLGDVAALQTRLKGDAVQRLEITSDGHIAFGSGAAVADLRLLRGGVGNLIMDSLSAAGSTILTLESTSGQRSGHSTQVAGDTFGRAVLWGDATLVGLELGPGNAARDVNLYRSAANYLTSDDKLRPASLKVQVKAGTPVDGDIVGGAESGDVVLDTTNSKIWFRVGATWKGVVIA